MALLQSLVLLWYPFVIHAFLAPQGPHWTPTYLLNASTITMQVNQSGYTNSTFAAQFGIVSFDWGNALKQWAAAHPMDSDSRMNTQAIATKAINPKINAFVYRNLVKALPWFGDIRCTCWGTPTHPLCWLTPFSG